jgi:HSP20 family protein
MPRALTRRTSLRLPVIKRQTKESSMLITRYRSPELSTWPELTAFPNRLARLLNMPFLTTPFPFEPTAFTPLLDVAEFEEYIKITCELPGLMKDEIKLDIDNGVLFIRGEKKEKKEEKTERMYMIERSYGMFERSFVLPPHLDLDMVKAEFVNGVLAITIPKIAPEKGRKVEILEK